MLSPKKSILSFKYAFKGLYYLFKEEHNAQIHLIATITVLIFGWVLKISQTEWFIILLLIGFVFSAELINSSIENICDLVSPEKNDYVKKSQRPRWCRCFYCRIYFCYNRLFDFHTQNNSFIELIP